MKVILIGNSSIDKTKEVGFQIDNDFDLVVRMNRYQTEGFENYIGSKTHIWSLNRTISLGHSRVHYNGPDCDLNSEFKRRQSPPGIKITSKAFGRDRRYPITN